MTQYDMRLALMESAVLIVARDGLEKATTKSIADKAGLSEAYVFLFYNSKEDLLNKTFLHQDAALIAEIMKYYPVMHMKDIDTKTKWYLLWVRCWRYLLKSPDSCLFYVRYYYSYYFKNYAYEEHMANCRVLIDKLKSHFTHDTDAEMMLGNVFENMLIFAMKAATGETINNDETSEANFKLIFNAIQPHLYEINLEN